jgi:hypothetical protein
MWKFVWASAIYFVVSLAIGIVIGCAIRYGQRDIEQPQARKAA